MSANTDSRNAVLDTQVVSYAMKGVPGLAARGSLISSVTAQEFLLAQSNDSRRLRYALPALINCPAARRGILLHLVGSTEFRSSKNMHVTGVGRNFRHFQA
jgi:hypothetical protein